MIRVLQVLPGLNRGGLETFVMNVYRSIDRSNIQFDFLTNMKKGDYSKEILTHGGKIYYIPPRRKGLSLYIKALSSFFEEKKSVYNAIHFHESSLTSIEILYFAKKSNIPIRIMHSHSSSIMGNKIHYLTHFFGKLLIKNLATHYFGCSDKALNWMFNYSGVRKKAKIINNGIDAVNFKYDSTIRSKTRSELGIGADTLVIGHIGRFSSVKNHKFLIDIFIQLKNLKENAILILVGDGELKQSIQQKVKDLKLDNAVLFLGSRSDTNMIYQAMDIFVMPSLYEGLPIVLVEAQASGLPVICSNRISKMSCMSENFTMLSIDENATVWANHINETKLTSKRELAYLNIIKNGYDIKTITTTLKSVYQGEL